MRIAIGLVCAFLILVALLVAGDVAWLCLCAAFPFYVAHRTGRTTARVTAWLVSLVVIGLHLVGFKIWGNEFRLIEPWKPLKNPRELTAIEPPGIVTLAGGTKYRLYGVIVTQEFTVAYRSWTNDVDRIVAISKVHSRVFRGSGN